MPDAPGRTQVCHRMPCFWPSRKVTWLGARTERADGLASIGCKSGDVYECGQLGSLPASVMTTPEETAIDWDCIGTIDHKLFSISHRVNPDFQAPQRNVPVPTRLIEQNRAISQVARRRSQRLLFVWRQMTTAYPIGSTSSMCRTC